MEIWKNVIGYESKYEISNYGRVKSKEIFVFYNHSKTGERLSKIHKERILKTSFCKGYNTISLSLNGVLTKYRLCRLVAINFIENKSNKPCVNHIDGVKTNDKASNLEWVTYKENMQHAYKNNLVKIPKGDECSNSIKVKCIKTNKQFDTIKEAAKYLNIDSSTLSRKLRNVYFNDTTIRLNI